VLGVLRGFATIGAVVALGWLLAHYKVLGPSGQLFLSRLAFFVASPALLLVVLSRTPISSILSANLLASAASVVVTVAAYLVVARWRWRPRLGEAVIGSLCAAYVNAGNLGIPIALYVLGDIALIAPTLLLQLLVLTPIAFALLDADARGVRPSLAAGVRSVFRNPVTVGALAGVVVSLLADHVPKAGLEAVLAPVELVGDMAVPAMLIAFGISLRRGPRPGAEGSAPHVGVVVALKLLAQPLAAIGVGYAAVGLRGHALFAAAVTAALPTAQNVFIYADTYRRGSLLARDAIFVSTFLSVPVILLLALLFRGV
jgi:malonate transporter and related proteins